MSGRENSRAQKGPEHGSLVHLCRLRVVQPPLDLGGVACEEGGEGAGQVS